jgi:hypothetical protein
MIAEGKLEFEIDWDGKQIAWVKPSIPPARCSPAACWKAGRRGGPAAGADAVQRVRPGAGRRRGGGLRCGTRHARRRAAVAGARARHCRRVPAGILLAPVHRPAGLLGEAARPGELADLRRRMPAAASEFEWLDVADRRRGTARTRRVSACAARLAGAGRGRRRWRAGRARRIADGAHAGAPARLRSGAPRPSCPGWRRTSCCRRWPNGWRNEPKFRAAADLAGCGRRRPARWRGSAASAHRAGTGGERAGRRRAARPPAELAQLPEQLREPLASGIRSASPRPGVGIAAVETARGTLLHCVGWPASGWLRYRIVAPTEWNFHPKGAFVRAAGRLPARRARSKRAGGGAAGACAGPLRGLRGERESCMR